MAQDYHVADIKLAEYGNKEIAIAEKSSVRRSRSRARASAARCT